MTKVMASQSDLYVCIFIKKLYESMATIKEASYYIFNAAKSVVISSNAF